MEPELRERLEEFAAARNLTVSQAARYILRRAFDVPAVEAAVTEELNGIQFRLRQRLGVIREGFLRVLEEQVDELLPPHMLEEPSVEAESEELEPLPNLPALPARSEDIVEGEVEEEVRGLGGRRRRRR
jgi:hypothetical protein